MSSNSTYPAVSPVSDKEMRVIINAFYQVATSFVLWGLQIALACHAIYILWKRGWRNSLSRKFMVAIVLIMLISSTATAFINLGVYIVTVPTIGIETPPDIARQLLHFDIGEIWLVRLNFYLSDVIVIWRAWALWPGNQLIRWALGVFIGVTSACTIVSAALSTAESAHNGPMYPLGALRMVLYIPVVTTNTLATTLICYKAWLYRQEIRVFASTNTASPSGPKSSIRLDRVFALFVETGTLYVIFFVINIVAVFGSFPPTQQGVRFNYIWRVIMNAVACIYPTVIIILVSKYMSQSDVVLSTVRNGPSASSLEKPQAYCSDRNEALSTIRFEMPRMPTITSSTTMEEDITTGYSVDKNNDKNQKGREIV